MLVANLHEPVLSLALDAVANIQQGDELAVGGLWSILTKVRDAVTDGHRLENLTWRLWHRARIAPILSSAASFPASLPRYPEIPPHPLSSPSLSVSSSSEGTGTSSDWDRDTAVGEDDDMHALQHTPGARRNPAVSPLLEKPHLDLVLGPAIKPVRAAPSPAPSSHHQHVGQGPALVCARPLPSPTPHQPPRADSGAGDDARRVRDVPPLPRPPSLLAPSNSVPRTALSVPDTSLFASEVLTATVTASSMPITLTTARKDVLTVGRLITQLFAEEAMVKPTRHGADAPNLTLAQAKALPASEEKRAPLPPLIVEPQPLPANTSSYIQPDSSPSTAPNSALTSATSTPRQSFPTVIVVNPTPHPTPPATPSPDESYTQFNLSSTATPIGRTEKVESHWDGSVNGQLATPVSMNGDARSVEPSFGTNHPSLDVKAQSSRAESAAMPLSPSLHLMPATAIALPEKPTLFDTSSHLPTPASEAPHALQTSEMSNTGTKTTSAPIPAPVPSEDKKFFLVAPHSGSGGSGHDSSESPDSLGAGSLSPDKRDLVHAGPLLGARDMAMHGRALLGRQEAALREDDVASSFSASSPRAPSVTSSKNGSSSKVKGRSALMKGGGRRKLASKRVALVANEGSKQEVATEVKSAEEIKGKSAECKQKSVKARGKEREVGERRDDASQISEASTVHPLPAVKSLQHLPSHCSHLEPKHLRQLPTNPPRRQQLPAPEKPHVNPAVPPNTRHLPYHPQLGHLGLGHLPTVPPKQRRPIEITETSSEYETTDTEGDESSWESESCSADYAGEGSAGAEAGAGPEAGPSKHEESSSKNGKTSNTNPSNNNRTRDAGEFARDAALEAQRLRDLFQKLPPRSYSNLAQLPRAKSGLSLLFRPDPETLPEGHPYRTSRSSHDLLARNWSAPAPPQAMAAFSKRPSALGPMQAAVNAEPVVTSVNSKASASGTGTGTNGRRSNGPPRNGYRPRMRPQDQEEETDSGEEDPEDAIQVSSSVAERRLAALMGPRGAQPQLQRPSASRATSHPVAPAQAPGPQPVSRTTTAPVLMHPYLPDPAPLQTPHTVRRNIISQELDEELRRNLLWERSQNQIQGRPARAPGSILPGPWRRLTAMNPEEDAEAQVSASDKAPGKRSFATQRTKSWAGEYHSSGW